MAIESLDDIGNELYIRSSALLYTDISLPLQILEHQSYLLNQLSLLPKRSASAYVPLPPLILVPTSTSPCH